MQLNVENFRPTRFARRNAKANTKGEFLDSDKTKVFAYERRLTHLSLLKFYIVKNYTFRNPATVFIILCAFNVFRDVFFVYSFSEFLNKIVNTC